MNPADIIIHNGKEAAEARFTDADGLSIALIAAFHEHINGTSPEGLEMRAVSVEAMNRAFSVFAGSIYLDVTRDLTMPQKVMAMTNLLEQMAHGLRVVAMTHLRSGDT